MGKLRMIPAARTSLVTLVALAAALVLAACGATDGQPAASEEPGPPVDADQPEPVPGQEPDMNECALIYAELAEAEAEYAEALTALMSGEETHVDATVAGLHAMTDAAPPEFRDDFATVADLLGDYLTAAVARDQFDLGAEPTEEQLEEIAELDATLDEAALSQAQANIDTYFTENC